MGCATEAKPAAPGCTIHFFQSASEPPSPLSGTASRPGEISLMDRLLRHCVSEQRRRMGVRKLTQEEGC